MRYKPRANIWLPVTAALLDSGAVVVGAWLAYAVRFRLLLSTSSPATVLPHIEWYLRLSLVLAGMTVTTMIAGGMYRFPNQEGLFEELNRASRHFFSAFTVMLAGLFFYREVTFSRITLGLVFGLSGMGLMMSRSASRWIRQALYRSGVAVRRAAVVGEGRQAVEILRHLTAHPEFGFSVAGGICEGEPASPELPRLGGLAEARQAIAVHHLDTLIIAPAEGEAELLPDLVKECYGVNVQFLYIPDILPANGRPRRVVKVGGVPLWALKETPFVGWHGLVKRTFDFVVGSAVLLVTLPLMAMASVAIKLDSRGPVIFRQRRVGLDGREFDCFKFRSMLVNAEAQTGPVWAVRDDPRTTRVGRLIRRWKIDELPQMWNVVRGDMSLVGPRPERPEFVRQFEQKIDGYHERHRVRAGLTGWAQVNETGGYSPIEVRTVYDRQYVENWSLLFDLKILWLTLVIVLKGETSN